MPCVHAKNRREYEAYVEANRRDVNEFEGVADLVEIIQIIHRDRKRDPLINWIPHPTPVDQLYQQLTDRDQARLVQYATGLVGTEKENEAEAIIRCLASFTKADLTPCQRSMIEQDHYWPCCGFVRANPEIREQLLNKLEVAPDNRGLLISCLAWIGDPVVVDLFEQWRDEPPEWRNEFRLHPTLFSKEAGWEPIGGAKRNLFFESCTALTASSYNSSAVVRAVVERSEHCPWCGSNQVDLIDVTLSDVGIQIQGLPRVQVVTCEICTCFGCVYGEIDAAGRSTWSSHNTRPESAPESPVGYSLLPRNRLVLGDARPANFAQDDFLPTTLSQIGGLPAWVQDEEYPQCPKCSDTMLFFAQIDHSDLERYGDGTYYAFLCPDCRITATHYQQT